MPRCTPRPIGSTHLRFTLTASAALGRRRRVRTVTAAALGTVIVAVGITAGGVKLFDQARSARVPPSPGVGASRPSVTTRPTGTRSSEVARAMANVRAFYTGYETARGQGQRAVDALIRAHVAGWYQPILEAPPESALTRWDAASPAAPVTCTTSPSA